MIYLYFDVANRTLYASSNLNDLGSVLHDLKWKDVDSVTADKERGQVVAHRIGTGIIVEFPLSRVVLTCVYPEK